MSLKEVAPAPTRSHARERAVVVRKGSKGEANYAVIVGKKEIFASGSEQFAQSHADAENLRLARNAANRAKYKKKLWEARLYVGPGDAGIKARLLAQTNINEYLRKLVAEDIKRGGPAEFADPGLAEKRAKSINCSYNPDGSIKTIQVIARDPFEVGEYTSWEAVNLLLSGKIQGVRP